MPIRPPGTGVTLSPPSRAPDFLHRPVVAPFSSLCSHLSPWLSWGSRYTLCAPETHKWQTELWLSI